MNLYMARSSGFFRWLERPISPCCISEFPVRIEASSSLKRNIQHQDDIVGIDFGTTNSRAAIMEAQVPTLLENDSGQAIPSFVAVDDKKRILVGEAAKTHAIAYPAACFFNVKTLLGRKFYDFRVQELKSKVPYLIIEGSNGEAWVEVHGRQFSPTKICAFIIAKLKKLSELYGLQSFSKAVIAAPIYFSDDQKAEIELAGRIAGLDVLGIIDEPIAAALSCKSIDGGIFAVFSLGGGTFSTTILEISNGVSGVKAKEHDTSLGGDDFDLILLDYLVEEIRKLYSVDISGDQMVMMRLKEAAEKAKLELSSSDQALVEVPFVTASDHDHDLIDAKITLKRSKFEELVEGLIERMRKLCRKCLEAAGVNEQEIDEVLMVNPEEAVAIGALLQGALIIEDQWKPSPHLLPFSLGIETLGGGFARIMGRHSLIPSKASLNITTSCDYHDGVSIRILQGEHMVGSLNKLLGELKLTGIPRALRGAVSIMLEFCVDTTGVLTVLAKSKDADMEWSTEMKLLDESEDFVRKMTKSAILFGRWEIGNFVLMQHRCVLEFKIERIEKMLNFFRKQFPPKLNACYGSRLADFRKKMDLENLLLLKATLGEAAVLEEALVTFHPSELLPDSDDEGHESC
ncbi:hypothetical protein Vadar_004883 [Vaccinium darrowii]|uniref:Uncharacterized protein n=1 Tax=Vaccinium darrowii TaxID=229202 RepID=A0ACB7XWW7_9ERIC|nr:hypothetical protein Vadar_004883 [Vaccinium darrowii]